MFFLLIMPKNGRTEKKVGGRRKRKSREIPPGRKKRRLKQAATFLTNRIAHCACLIFTESFISFILEKLSSLS